MPRPASNYSQVLRSGDNEVTIDKENGTVSINNALVINAEDISTIVDMLRGAKKAFPKPKEA